MAGGNVSINVNVKAQQLNRLEARLNRVQNILNRINSDPIAIDDGRAAKAVKEIASQISNLASEQVKLNTINMSTIAGLKDKAAAYKIVAENAKVGKELFKDTTIASERLSRRAATADLERLKVLKEFYSTQLLVSKNKEPVRVNYGLEELARQQEIAFSTNSIASLEAYRSELEQIYELMSGNAPGRSQLLDMITEVDKRLKTLQRPTQKIPELAKPAGQFTELGSPKEYIQRQKHADDLLASQRKLERISVNLDSAAISQNDKLEIRNRLGEAFNAIQQQNFQLAKKLGAEADRYIRDAEHRQVNEEKANRLRSQFEEKNAKYQEKAAAFIAATSSNISDGLTPLQRWQQGFNDVEKTASEILNLSEELGKKFDEDLAKIPYMEGSLKTRLGGGEQVAAQERYRRKIETGKELGPGTSKAEKEYQQRAIDAAKEKLDLNNTLGMQLMKLQKISKDYLIQEEKGVILAQDKKRLEEAINIVEQKRFAINQDSIDAIDKQIEYYRLLLNLKTAEAKAAGTYQASRRGGAGGKTEAEIIEGRRNRLLSNALTLQGNLISIEGRGGDIAQEKLEIEAKILELKNMQNKASSADLEIIAQQIQVLRNKSKEISNTVAPEKKRIPFLEKRFGKEKASAISEGLVGGAFPLLFGQGIGASAGGALGGIAGGLMGGGLGMGLSLLGTSIGGFLDQAVVKAQELANELLISGDNASKLRSQGLYYTAELEDQVRLLKEAGKYEQAIGLQRSLPFQTAGDINGGITRGVGMAANELGKAWKGVQSAVGATIGLLAAPFMYVITAALRAVQGIFVVVNLITSGIGEIITKLFHAEKNTQALEEAAIRGTEEYENQVAEINKQIAANEKLLKIASVKNQIMMQGLSGSKVGYELAVKEADAQERLRNLAKEIQEQRDSTPTGTSELRLKLAIKESQMIKKFHEEEASILIKDARGLFDSITENNKRIAEIKKQNEQEYADMVRQSTREQQDYDIAVARKIQDIRLQAQEDELNFIKRINDAKLKGEQIANQERTLQRSIQGALSEDPTADIVNNTKTAVEEWRTGRREVENEYANKQKEIQLQAQKAEVAIQRYKFDNALRIARANEDSQLRINRMQQEINKQNEIASKNEFSRQVESTLAIINLRRAAAYENALQAAQARDIAKRPESNTMPNDLKALEAEYANAYEIYASYDRLAKKIEPLLKSVPGVATLPGVGPAPKLTDTSAAASAASKDAANQVANYENQVNALEKIEGLKVKDFNLTKQVLSSGVDQLNQLKEIVKSQNDARISREKYRDLITKGINPALAQEQIRIEQIRNTQLQNLDATIKTLKAYNNPKLQDIIKTLTDIRSGIETKSAAAISGAQAAFAPGEKMKDFVAESIAKLYDLESVAISVSQSIGDAVGGAMNEGINGLIDGTMTAQEVFANFLKNVSQILMQEATKMIATYIAIGLAKQFAGLFGGGGGTTGTETNAQFMDRAFSTGAFNNVPSIGGYANGGMFSGNGVIPFAMGGAFTNSIVTAPTLFKFANGGAMSTGVMGEAGPEAVMPLTRGPDGRLGVQASGGGGAVVNGDINITVENTGETLSPAAQKQIAGQVQGIVLATLADQKRGGGMLR